jgi:glycosyltransferase involved in cell wall biosynthesis
LFAHSFYRLRGGEDHHVEAQVELVSQSHDVRLIRESNVELANSPSTAARMLYSKKKKEQVKAVIDDFGPDVIHIHNTYPSLGPAVHLAARERGVPIVMTVHNFRLRCPNGFMFTEGAICRRCESGHYYNAVLHRCFGTRKQRLAYPSILWLHRFMLRLDDTVATFIVPSEFMRHRLVSWGMKDERVRLVRHFVNDRTSGKATAPGRYGLFLGRLSPEKGLHLFLRCLRQAGDPEFYIAGEGPMRTGLERLARGLGLVNTRFLGWKDKAEAIALLNGARYVAVPSVWEETASLSALEGLAAGRPLLVSDRGALPELVGNGAGFACRPEDALATSNRITQLMRDDDVWRRASTSAASFAREQLTSELHVARLEGVYRDATIR